MRDQDTIGSFLKGSVRRRGAAALAVAAAAVLAGRQAAAQVYTWASPVSGNWATPSNWVGGVSPVGDPSAQLVFPAGSYSTDANGDQTLNAMTFNGAAGDNVNVDGFGRLTFTGADPRVSLSGGSFNFFNVQLASTGGLRLTSTASGNVLLASQIFPASGETIIANTGSGSITMLGSESVVYSSSMTSVLVLANTGSGQFLMGNLTVTPQVLDGVGLLGTLRIAAGTVRASNSQGDLFSESLTLEVLSGATFDFNNNGESMGAIKGDGRIIAGAAGLTLNLAVTNSFGGVFEGSQFVQLNARSLYTFTNNINRSNAWTGTLIVGGGSTARITDPLAFAANPVSVIAGDLDLNGLSATIGGLSGFNLSGPLNIGSTTLTVSGGPTPTTWSGNITGAGNLVINAQGVRSFIGTNAFSGTTTVTAGTYRTNYSNLAASSAITVAPAATLGVIVPTNTTWSVPNLTNTGGLTKEGPGTLTFNATTSAPAITRFGIDSGAVVLDRTAVNGNVLSSAGSTALRLGTSSLTVLGNSSAAGTQAFSGTTLEGSARVAVTSGTGQQTSLTLGAITRTGTRGGTLDVTTNSLGGGSASVTTTSANNASGTLGGWATVNGGTEFARVEAGTGRIIGGATYTNNQPGWGSNLNTNVTANFTTPAGGTTGNVRFTTTGSTVTLSGATTVTFGGILVAPSVGAAGVAITNAASGTNNLRSPANTDLVIHQYSTAGALTIGGNFANAGGTATNAVAGSLAAATGVGFQVVSVPSASGIQLGSRVTGGAFPSNANARVVQIDGNQQVTISYFVGPTSASTGSTLTFTPNTNIVKAGPGRLVLTGNNAHNGMLILNEGVTQVGAVATIGGVNAGVYFNGGTLDATATIAANGSGAFVVGPAGGTLNVRPGVTVTRQGYLMFGTGDLTVTGGGTFSVGNNVSPFTGRFNVENGTLRLTSNQIRNSQGARIAPGSQFLIADTTSGPFNVGPGGALILNGDGPSSTGAWRHTLDEAGSANYAFNSPIFLESTARFFPVNRGSDRVTDRFPLPITGPGGLVKDGDGLMVLESNLNTYAGPTILRNSILRLGATGALPATTTVQFGESGSVESATLDLGGFNATVSGLTKVGAGIEHQVANLDTNPAVTLTVNYNGVSPQTFTGRLGGQVELASARNFGLTKSGTGTFEVLGESTFTGPVTVTAGTLRFGDSSTARPFTLGDGATLAVANASGNALPMTTFAVGTSGATGLNLEINGPTPGAGLISVQSPDGLSLNGTINLAVSSITPFTVGTIPLIRYSGSVGGTGLSALTAGTLTLPNLVTGNLVFNPGSIDLQITAADFLRWNGNVNADWDAGLTANFRDQANAPRTFSQSPADIVVFDDSATGTRTVNLVTAITPSNVLVDTASTYTFTGAGSVSGPTALSKAGGGTLVLLTNNSYTGPTFISGGNVVVGNGGTSGSLGTGPVTNNGTLTFDRSDNLTVAGAVSGTGPVVKAGTNTVSFAGGMTLNAPLTIAGGAAEVASGRLSGPVSGAGSLVKTSVGTLIVTTDVTTTGGPTIISDGVLQIGDSGSSGTISTNVTSSATGRLRFARADSYTFAGSYFGPGSLEITSGSVKFTGSIGHTGTTVIANSLSFAEVEFETATDTDLPGAISGFGRIIKSGPGTLRLLGDSDPSFSGEIVVNGGTILQADLGLGGDVGAQTFIINDGGRYIFGQGGVTGENPDLGDDAYATVNTGGTWEHRIGENMGGIRLAGGTLQLNGGNITAAGSAGEWIGFELQSGTVSGDGRTLGATAAVVTDGGSITKLTSGTVNFTGSVGYGATLPFRIREGKAVFTSGSLPSAGTATLTLGGGGSLATLAYADAANASIARPVAIDGGSSIEVVNAATTLTLPQTTTGGGDLLKTGPGTLALASSATYSGVITLDAGRVQVPNNTGTRGYVINSGATLQIDFANSTAVPASALTFGSGNGVLSLNLPAGLPVAPVVNVTNTDGLSANGGAVVRVTPVGAVTPGTYPLIDYSGTIAGLGFAGFNPAVQVVSAGNRVTANLIDNTATTTLDLNVVSIDQVKWNGNVNGSWDINTTPNFRLSNLNAATTYLESPFPDNPIFDETATGTRVVSLATAVAPASVTVSGPLDYSFQGPGSLTGATGITKSGTSTLTITTDNTHTGVTTINDGTVAVGNGGATGNLGTGNITVAATGTLAINRSGSLTLAQQITGTGVISHTGPGTLTLTANNSGFTGTVSVTGGTVVLADIAASGGDINASSIVASTGGTFVIGQGGIVGENPDVPLTTVFTANPGGTIEVRVGEQAGALALRGGTLTLNGDVGADFDATTGTFTGVAIESGLVQAINTTGSASLGAAAASGGITKTTPGTATFTGNITIGSTTPVSVSEGLLSFEAGNFPAAGSATLGVGGASTAGTLRLAGAGTVSVARPVTLGAGGGIVDVASATGSLTFSGNVSGASLTKSGPGLLAVTGSLAHTGDTTATAGTLDLQRTLLKPASVLSASGSGTSVRLSAPTGVAPVVVADVATLSASGGARLTVAPTDRAVNAPRLAVTSSLSLTSGGQLDLANNDLVVRTGSLSAVTSLVASGSLTSSTAGTVTADPRDLHAALGTLANTDAFGFQRFSTFDGVALSAADVIVKYTYRGDTDLNGTLDARDFNAVLNGFSNGLSGWHNGDVNYDGIVNATDWSLFLQAYQFVLGGGSPFSETGTPGASIPEPAALGLVAAALPLLSRRRRR